MADDHIDQGQEAISTEISYLEYKPKYDHEKLYTLNYDSGGVIERTNVSNKPTAVMIENFRTKQGATSFDEYGFSAVKLPSRLNMADFDDDDIVEKVFYAEVREKLRSYFNAAKVEILEHQIRKREAQFPIATGRAYQNLLPTTLVHIDYTLNSAHRSSHAAFKKTAEQHSGRLMTVNVWKSLQGPGNDWPLALCDSRTVNHQSELVPHDIVFVDRFTENARVYHNPNHKWYWFKDLALDEAIVFRQTDSRLESGAGVPHTGFKNPTADPDAAPRVSIEVRAFIYFDD